MTYSANIGLKYSNSSVQQTHTLTDVNKKQIGLIRSFNSLNSNWDLYGANEPSPKAINKAISFAKYLSDKGIDIYFTAPTPDGDILIELQNEGAHLEFLFSCIDEEDKVIATYKNEHHCEAAINDTIKQAYLKWLICPNGRCPDF
ncbi:MAG: hypothetical protein WBP08_18380 [Saprospiraceae bacterium]